VTRRRAAGVAGAVVGAAALGAGIGLAAERYAIGRTRLRPDPEAAEPFFRLPADRTRRVRADDGVQLHVEEVGPPSAPVTVVFSHGYTQELAVWHYQRKALGHDDGIRCVFWDQRSHGRSDRSPAEHSTIDWLGRDLRAVLEATAPAGPAVLVGHSMGGMTVMALADQHPELFGPVVTGVALIGTSTGKLAEVTFGLPAAITPVTRRALPWLTRGMQRRPGVFERGRRLGTDLAFLIARHEAFGDRDVSPALVEFVERMTAGTRIDVIAEFYDTFTTHEKLHALEVLRGVATLVLVGSKDLITPAEHSELIAEALPTAQLVVLEGAGHMVQLERAQMVTLHLRALVARALRPADRSA
jgi:pimeloyl-ACP methyl ester carboxylesterase